MIWFLVAFVVVSWLFLWERIDNRYGPGRSVRDVRESRTGSRDKHDGRTARKGKAKKGGAS